MSYMVCLSLPASRRTGLPFDLCELLGSVKSLISCTIWHIRTPGPEAFRCRRTNIGE
jgi:hypothetical protein